MTNQLPQTAPDDERSGVETMFAGLAIPYMLGALMICLGLVIGGTFGFILAYGSLLLLAGGVVIGIMSFIISDDETDAEPEV